MKYRVIGQNKDSAARMVLEFEAESKGAAERKALQQGMAVHRVEDITDGYTAKATEPNPRAGRLGSGGGGMLKWVVILVILAVVAYIYHAPILRLLPFHF